MQSSALYVITYTEVTYPSDPFDVTLNPLSPLQIQAKMISQERAKALLPDGEFGFGNITCKDINEVQGIIMYLYLFPFQFNNSFLRHLSLTILFYVTISITMPDRCMYLFDVLLS